MTEVSSKLGYREKIFFGIGEIAATSSNTIIGFLYLYYLTDVVGLSPAYAGLAILIGKLWDAITDPMIGLLSDRTKSRWGRRRVYLLFGAIPLGITFFFLWAIPASWNELTKLFYTSISYMAHMTSLTVIVVPYQTLMVEMTDDYDQRTALSSYRMSFNILGGMIAVISAKLLTEMIQPTYRGFLIMGIIIGFIISIAPLFPFWGCQEKLFRDSGAFSTREDLQQIWNNIPFRHVLIMFLMIWSSIQVMMAMLVYFVQYYAQLQNYFLHLLVILQVVATVFIPFWLKISHSLGKRKTYLIGTGFFGLCILSLILVPPKQVLLSFILAFLVGIGLSSAQVLSHAMVPDSIDYGYWQTGKRKEGVYYGVLTFVQKIATASALGLSGLILDLTGYVPNAIQTTRALWAIRILLGLFPGILILIGMVAIYHYPISKDFYQKIKEELIDREKRRVNVTD
ncbi:MAG: MFS transporter [Candidatus Caldatribacteriota bacterium]